MKYLSVLMLPLLASCPGAPPPDGRIGYDCSAQPRHTGVVSVANAIAGKYIVIQKPTTARGAVQTYDVGVTGVKTLEHGYAATIAQAALSRVLANPNVEYIQEDGVKSITPRVGVEAVGSWGLDRSDQHTLPLDGNYTPGAFGFGVNVAVIDTGISPNPDFVDRLAAEYFTAHGTSAKDGHGHGTHVSGTVAGQTYGIAKQAILWAVKVLDDNGSGSDSAVIQGIEWVIRQKKSDPARDWVINMSLGGGQAPALDRTTCDAIAAGITVVMAAGNEGANADSSSPGRVVQGVTVGASDRFDVSADFSNYGTLVDLYAPGVDIRSTSNDSTNWVSMSGTSMSSPHVAGGAALYLGRNPGAAPSAVRDGMVAAATKDSLTGLGVGSPNALLFVRAE